VTVRDVGLAACLSLSLMACSPALNWRATTLDRMIALLPCKPDTATRQIEIGRERVEMTMAGCEAGGAIYAISRVHALAGSSQELQIAWQAATLANMQATQAQTRVQDLRVKGDVASVQRLEVSGKRPDGQPVRAQLAWIVSRDDVFHLAAYADSFAGEAQDTFFTEITIR
jgi:hypothetical protein